MNAVTSVAAPSILPILLKDGYKVGHVFQYPTDTEMVYSNFTARKGRDRPLSGVIFFGLQYFIQEYLLRQFDDNFFQRDEDEVVEQYSRRIDNYLGPGVTTDHIRDLHRLGYLPLLIKALPEGSLVPYGVPVLTIRNTHPEFFWVTNMLETLMSNVLWMASTSATTARAFRDTFDAYADATDPGSEFPMWQGHDFSMRGMSGIESAMLSGAGHLLSFTGTDTIPAIDFLERYYGADCEKELIGGSVPATEHSVMSMGGDSDEQSTFERLLTEVYPGGILSVVSDTWDFWRVITEFMPNLKDEVMARDGKLVIRPDSGDPVKIVVGDPGAKSGTPEHRGAIECLWDTFGGDLSPTGYRRLDPHVGLIYGDGITLERQAAILDGLKKKNFASTNIVMGVGSYTYQHVTRDTDGWAMKATAGRTTSGGLQEIYKDPKTDDGGKKSARGLLRVDTVDGKYVLTDRVTIGEEQSGALEPVFCDSMLLKFQTLAEIRELVV